MYRGKCNNHYEVGIGLEPEIRCPEYNQAVREIEQENITQQHRIKDTEAQLQREKKRKRECIIDQDKLNVRRTGFPAEQNEDTKEIVGEIATLSCIYNFSINQIDIAHRTSKRKMASITALFHVAFII